MRPCAYPRAEGHIGTEHSRPNTEPTPRRLHAAEYRVQAALARLDREQAARYPVCSYRARWACARWRWPPDRWRVGATKLADQHVRALLDGGAVRAHLRVQDAVLEQAGSLWRRELTALKDVHGTLVALRQDRERLQHLQAALLLPANAELVGAPTLCQLDLIDFSCRARYPAYLAVHPGRGTIPQASQRAPDHVRLYKALGSSWTPDTDASLLNDAHYESLPSHVRNCFRGPGC